MAWDAGLPHKTLLQPPNAGTAEPFRVSPPEAVAYPLELRGHIIEVSVYGFEHETAAAAILTNLDTKLENAGVDPRIPWLGNRRLRFTFH